MKRLLAVHDQVRTCRACFYGSRGLEAARESYGGTVPADVVFVLGRSQLEAESSERALGVYYADIINTVWKEHSGHFLGYTHAVKCVDPSAPFKLEEAVTCLSHLEAELREVGPSVLVALGRDAAEMLGLYAGPAWRGRWGTFQSFAVMTSWHPSFLALNPVPRYRSQALTDLRAVRQFLGG